MKVLSAIVLLFVAFKAAVAHEVNQRHASMEEGEEAYLRSGARSETKHSRTEHTRTNHVRNEHSNARHESFDYPVEERGSGVNHVRTEYSDSRNEAFDHPLQERSSGVKHVRTKHSDARHKSSDYRMEDRSSGGRYIVKLWKLDIMQTNGDFSWGVDMNTVEEWRVKYGDITLKDNVKFRDTNVLDGAFTLKNALGGACNPAQSSSSTYSCDFYYNNVKHGAKFCVDAADAASFTYKMNFQIGDYDGNNFDNGPIWNFDYTETKVSELESRYFTRTGVEGRIGRIFMSHVYEAGSCNDIGYTDGSAGTGTTDPSSGTGTYDIDPFCGDTCELCDTFDGLSAATQALHTSMQDGALKDIQTYVGHAANFAEFVHEVAERADNIETKLDNFMDDVFEKVHPIVKGIPYIGSLLTALKASLNTLKTAISYLAENEETLETLAENLGYLNGNMSDVLPPVIVTANLIAGQANQTIHMARDEGCASCGGQLSIQLPIDAALIDDFLTTTNDVLSHLSIGSTFPQVGSIDLELLDDIEAAIDDFTDVVMDIYEKVKIDSEYMKCCDHLGQFAAKMSDLFTDLASLITCASDGLTMGGVKAALSVFLDELDPLLDRVNSPIETYNSFATELRNKLSKIEYLDINSGTTLVEYDGSTCLLEVADVSKFFSPLCAGGACPVSTINPFSLGQRTVNGETVFREVARNCENAWNDVKDMTVEDCCPAAREHLGVPAEGWPPGHSCLFGELDFAHPGLCAEPRACLNINRMGFKCLNGTAWSPCMTGYDCADGYVCLANSPQYCTRGKDTEPCTVDWDCKTGLVCACGACTTGGVAGDCCGENDDCENGRCVDDLCRDGVRGDPCESESDCDSNHRCEGNVALFLGTCEAKAGKGSSCNEDSDCISNICARDKCTEGEAGEACGHDGDCLNERCVDDKCRDGYEGDPCEVDSDCEDDFCVGYFPGFFMGTCTVKLGSCGACLEDDDCQSGICKLTLGCAEENGKMKTGCLCSSDSHCNTSDRCDGGVGSTCQRKASKGSSCNEDSDCISNICARDKCTEGGKGEACGHDGDCLNGRCVDDICREGTLYDKCEKHTDCNSGRCDKPLIGIGECKSKLSNGSSCGENADCQSNNCNFLGECKP